LFPVVVGLNYRTAPVEVREKLSCHHSQIKFSLQELNRLAGIKGAVLLSTCNRLEIYTVTNEVRPGLRQSRIYTREV
jgi:glutamyl-tRNA reductase